MTSTFFSETHAVLFKDTLTLANSLEPYQLINALADLAFEFSVHLNPGGDEPGNFYSALNIMNLGMQGSMCKPDIWSELLTGTGNNDDIGHRPGGGR